MPVLLTEHDKVRTDHPPPPLTTRTRRRKVNKVGSFPSPTLQHLLRFRQRTANPATRAQSNTRKNGIRSAGEGQVQSAQAVAQGQRKACRRVCECRILPGIATGPEKAGDDGSRVLLTTGTALLQPSSNTQYTRSCTAPSLNCHGPRAPGQT